MSYSNPILQSNSRFSDFFAQKRGDIRKQRRAIEELLGIAPNTVIAISEKTGMEPKLVLWNLIGMLRWGAVEIVSTKGNELVYALREG